VTNSEALRKEKREGCAYPDTARWIRASGGSGRKLRRGSRCRQYTTQTEENRISVYFFYRFRFKKFNKRFELALFKAILEKCFSFRSCSFKTYMNKNGMEYLNGINLSQSNLCRPTPNLVIDQSSSSRIQTSVRKFSPAMYAERKRLSGFAETKASHQTYNKPDPSQLYPMKVPRAATGLMPYMI
jgi:hypothetical protein